MPIRRTAFTSAESKVTGECTATYENSSESMMKKRKKGVSRASWKKWLLKLFLWIVIALAGLSLSGVVLLLVFPEEKAGSFVSKKLSDALGRPVRVESVSINPFGRIDVRGVRVGFTEEEGIERGAFFSLDRLGIQFKWLPLLKKRLDISGVLIDGPRLHLVSLHKDGSAAAKEKMRAAEVDSGSPPKRLPLAFGLFHLTLNDFRFTMTIPDSSGETFLALDGVHLDASNLSLPRDYTEAPEGLRGRVRLFMQRGSILLKKNGTGIQAAADLNLEGRWEKEKRWSLGMDFSVTPMEAEAGSEVRLSLQADGEGYGDQIHIGGMELCIGKMKMATLSGEVEHLGRGMSFDLSLGGDAMVLEDLKHELGRLLPARWMKPIEGMDVEGSLLLMEGKVSGSLDRFTFRCRSALHDVKVAYPSGGIHVGGSKGVLCAEGEWRGQSIEAGKIVCDMDAESVEYRMNDSVSFSLKDVFIAVNSEMNRNFLPVRGSLHGGSGKLFGGSLGFDFNWTLDSRPAVGIAGIQINGRLHGDSLRAEAMPNVPQGTTGMLNVTADVVSDASDGVEVSVSAVSPGISYIVDTQTETTPGLELTSTMALNMDSELREWRVDSGTVQLNDLVFGKLSGSFDAAEKSFRIRFSEGEVRNERLFHFFPSKLQKQLETMRFFGKEAVAVEIDGRRIGDSLSVRMDGNLQFMGVRIEDPVHFLRLEDIAGGTRFRGNPRFLEGEAEVTVGRLFLERMRQKPFAGSVIRFDWRMQDRDSLWTENGTMDMKSMGVKGDIFFGMGQMKKSPTMTADFNAVFQSEDSVEMTEGMSVSGRMTCGVHGEMIDAEKRWLRVTGDLEFDSLNVVKSGLFALTEMQGRVPFQFDVDAVNKVLLPPPDYVIHPWMRVENQRTVYRNLFPRMGALRVGRIDVAGYQMQELVLDALVEQGTVQIPLYNVRVLGGNVGGSMVFHLRTGQKKDIAYEIRAQAARINSAALMGESRGREEETELNATLVLKGRGIDIEQGIDLDGYFHITKMGPDFASTLLRGMDPQGSDRSIRMTRRLLNMGWKPKLFSFELRHGYVYPALSLSQPWFSPIRIPGELEYGRLPLAFFLKPRLGRE